MKKGISPFIGPKENITCIKDYKKMTNSQKCTVVSLILSVSLTYGCSKETQKPITNNPQKSFKTDYVADWNSLKQRNPAPDWFRDEKFGIYFHWGVYSVPAFENEWYPRNMYDIGSPAYQHHVKNWGEPNVFGYPDFVPMFKADKFDVNEWADLFVKAGARFAMAFRCGKAS
jgi:alpha-L-fucosidase